MTELPDNFEKEDSNGHRYRHMHQNTNATYTSDDVTTEGIVETRETRIARLGVFISLDAIEGSVRGKKIRKLVLLPTHQYIYIYI